MAPRPLPPPPKSFEERVEERVQEFERAFDRKVDWRGEPLILRIFGGITLFVLSAVPPLRLWIMRRMARKDVQRDMDFEEREKRELLAGYAAEQKIADAKREKRREEHRVKDK